MQVFSTLSKKHISGKTAVNQNFYTLNILNKFRKVVINRCNSLCKWHKELTPSMKYRSPF